MIGLREKDYIELKKITNENLNWLLRLWRFFPSVHGRFKTNELFFGFK